MANQNWTNILFIIALLLVIIGALYWGWIGLTRPNISSGSKIIYILIGAAGLYVLYNTAVNYNK